MVRLEDVTGLLLTIGVSIGSALAAGGLSTPSTIPAALPGALRAHVQNERLQTVTSVRGLPLGVREGLQALFGSGALDIADPHAEFQATDVMIKPNLPVRRLVAAACSIDHCLVYYERGGFVHTWHALLFHWTPTGTRIEAGGAAPGGMASIDDVRRALLSGAIKAQAKGW